MKADPSAIAEPLDQTPGIGCGCSGAKPVTHRTSGALGWLPALLLALAPKCPFCWAAYMGALGSLGISLQIPFQPWLIPLLAGLLLVNLAVLFSRTRASGNYGPFLLCLTGSAVIGLGKFALESTPLLMVGLSAMLAGSVWSVATRRV